MGAMDILQNMAITDATSMVSEDHITRADMGIMDILQDMTTTGVADIMAGAITNKFSAPVERAEQERPWKEEMLGVTEGLLFSPTIDRTIE